jgi:hypothetical protein
VGKIWYGKRKTDVLTGKLGNVKKRDWKIADALHEGIVKKEVFDEVQKIINSRRLKRTKPSRTYLLAGIIRCG